MITRISKKGYSPKQIIRILDRRYGLARLESLLAVNWLNPIATLWLNFRSFPFSQAIKLPIYVYGRPRFYSLCGSMRIIGKVKSGMIKFNHCQIGAPNNLSLNSEICNQGDIIFYGPGLIGTGNKINVEGKLSIGANFKITDMCNVGCYSKIEIGDQSWIVHRCQITDSDYHYIANFNDNTVKNSVQPIKIGKSCWIANSTTIVGGAIIPDYTLVCSNSLINKDYSHIPKNSLLGGIPAKLIATGYRRIDNSNINERVFKFYRSNPEKLYKLLPNENENTVSSILDNNYGK